MSFDSKILEFIQLEDDIAREMPIVTNETFKGETIHIDFKRYQNCDFDDCTIVIEYGISSFRHCDFNRCNFTTNPGSPAAFVIQMDRMLRAREKS